ncbi:MAG: bifunctional [glutamine synthetase] adenylyltransferase/[glutamine synthetase]-adenylyl-L-tyrosine phosphorylase [Nakamurella sp.]
MSRGEPTLARFGLPDTALMRGDLAAAGLWPDGGAGGGAEFTAGGDSQAVLATLARTGRPELAVRQLSALIAALESRSDGLAEVLYRTLREDAAFRLRLLALFGASETLGEHVVTHPDAWLRLVGYESFAELTAPERCASLMRAVVLDADGRALPYAQAVACLRIEYRSQLAVIAAADVAGILDSAADGPTVQDVGQALSALADALLESALTLATVAHPGQVRFAVIAMGKCGARELNYLSDVDVMFVVSEETEVMATGGSEPAASGSAGSSDGSASAAHAAISAHAVGPETIRIATARATEMMRICGQIAWEVDAALRPEGKAGPLVRTLIGYDVYYQKWAKTWEFQALLKARAAAGDRELGHAFLTLVEPQVWSAADRDDFVADVQSMRRRVRDSVPVTDRDTELKLGSGGLRDVEFAVQLMQLVHGRADESLRTPGTLAALGALTAGGYVGREDGAELADAYAFERRIEHLAQLQHLRRTHSVPASRDGRVWLARAAGLAKGGVKDAEAELASDLARHEATIRRLHEKLFYRPLLAAVAAVPTEELRLTEKAAAARLAALGFAAPGPALRHIAALTGGLSRRAAIQRTLLPVLLGTFADSPDPDRGLLGYRTVSDALAETPWYLRLLRDEGLVAQRLARLLGTSRLVADLIERAPEVLRLLARTADLVGPDPVARAAEVAGVLAARADRARTAEVAAASARSARRHDMLRLACADLLGIADSVTIMHGLTSIADATVLAALAAAHRRVSADRLTVGAVAVPGVAASDGQNGADSVLAATVSVIAMGRFGGCEMGYSSDADVLFVAAPTHPDADPTAVSADATAIAELATRLLGKPSPDPALLIDADLRPEGRGGPLVRTISSYIDYWRRNVQPWQRQALLRARAIDPEDSVARDFIAAIEPVRYPTEGLSAQDAREIKRIKARVDNERMPRGADRTLHTKLGRGGLADVEWTVQLIQLQHAGALPELRVTGTRAALRAAVNAGLVDAASASALTDGWSAATRARNAIMLVTGKPGDEIPPHGKILAGIARACGYPATVEPGAFIDDYRRATRHARRAVDALFDGA